ncbi:MAG: Tol-Pal system protein TolB [Proteobacteria bacterium]|nr:Tol-Pal system protein TolB [Pseudomonadota bacterium]
MTAIFDNLSANQNFPLPLGEPPTPSATAGRARSPRRSVSGGGRLQKPGLSAPAKQLPQARWRAKPLVFAGEGFKPKDNLFLLATPPLTPPPRGGEFSFAKLRGFSSLFIFPLFLILAFFAQPAHALLKVDVTQGVVEPIPIAISPFLGRDGNAAKAAENLVQVISQDLERSGLFAPLDPHSFVQDSESLQASPRFADWRVINAQALVSGVVVPQSDGRLRVEFRLWDIFAEQQMTGMAYFTVPQNWRRIAHIIADAIYKRITGEDGYFDTRIVYISESGPENHRMKRLSIMDQDGANHRFLTDGRTLILTPRFSPTLQEITYLAYYNNRPRVYLFNIDSGRQEALGDFPGMTFAPRFSPDGKKVIFSLIEQGGDSNIFVMDLRTRQVSRLTNHPSINTAPSFSPNGGQITFESDRGGSQQVYVMDASGGNLHRITFGSGKYGTPVWSPRGDYIAFTKQSGGEFSIGIMRPDGSGERILTSAFHAEGPTWAPNGRVLIYFKERPGAGGKTSRLYSIDITGHNERELVTPLDGSDPAWSPLIP